MARPLARLPCFVLDVPTLTLTFVGAGPPGDRARAGAVGTTLVEGCIDFVPGVDPLAACLAVFLNDGIGERVLCAAEHQDPLGGESAEGRLATTITYCGSFVIWREPVYYIDSRCWATELC